LSRVPLRPGEKERLEREAFEAKGFVANLERLLRAAPSRLAPRKGHRSQSGQAQNFRIPNKRFRTKPPKAMIF
jgi:hypothetical protein